MTRGFSISGSKPGHLSPVYFCTRDSTQTTQNFHDVRWPLCSWKAELSYLSFLLGDLVFRKTRRFVVYHFYFKGKLVSYALYLCVYKFFPLSSSWPSAIRAVAIALQIQRGWLFQEVQLPRSSGLAVSRAKKVTCLRCGAGNDQERAEDMRSLHPWKLTWNQKITQLKRNIIFQTSSNVYFWVPC